MDLWKVKILLQFFLVAFFYCKCYCQKFIPENPLTKMSLEDRINYYGYPVELHTITTQDNYILSLYRISGDNDRRKLKYKKVPKNSKNSKKSPVLLLHGMGGSPSNYFVMGNNSIALYLVDRGYDVWSLCCRGVECSHKPMHKYFDWENQNYWKYSLQEIAIYDLPPTIDYIFNKTNQPLFMLGHSAGNTIQFILLSELPEYNKKIKIATAFAPTVFLGLTEDPTLKLLSSLVKFGKGLYFRFLGNFEGVPIFIVKLIMELAKVCHHQVLSKVCIKVLSIVGSHSSLLVDHEKILRLIISDASFRLSAMEVFQYAEIVNTDLFMKYDYGKKKNMKIYGQKMPPLYNLTKITCPTALFYGQHDAIASVQGVRKLKKHLPNVIMDYMVPFKRFTHTDFIFAHNASKLVYQSVAKLFKDFDDGKSYVKIVKNKG